MFKKLAIYVIVGLVLFCLVGCGTNPPVPQKSEPTKVFLRESLPPLNLKKYRDVNFVLIKQGDLPMSCLTFEDYRKAMNLNAILVKRIKDQQSLIKAYKDFYEPKTLPPEKKKVK